MILIFIEKKKLTINQSKHLIQLSKDGIFSFLGSCKTDKKIVGWNSKEKVNSRSGLMQ